MTIEALENIVILYGESHQMVKGDPADLKAERESMSMADLLLPILKARYQEVVKVPLSADRELVQILAPYPPDRWLIFNLVDGLEGRLFEESRVAWALEAMGYRFTGSKGEALSRSTHKGITKDYLVRAEIPTPAGRVFNSSEDVAVEGLSFPLIVKPVAEDASVGISEAAVVRTPEALRERIAYVRKCYAQAAVVEDFVTGREFEVSVWEGQPGVLPVTEIDFQRGGSGHEAILSFDAKWDQTASNYLDSLIVCPAPLTEAEHQQVTEVARRAAEALSYRGYARIDVRMTPEGKAYVIDVNCNPDLMPDGGFFWAAQAAGYSFEAMIYQVVEFANVSG